MTAAPPASLPTRIPGVVLLAASLVSIALVLTDGATVGLWAVVLAGGTAVVARWLGWSLSLALTVGAFFVLEYLVLRVGPIVGIPIPTSDLVVWAPVSIAASVILILRPGPLAGIDRRGIVVTLAAFTGSIAVIATTWLAQIVPGAVRLAWAMNSDFINSLIFARRMLADGGIDPASTPQPTPLPFAMMAANMAGGRDSLPDASVLEHDVMRSVQVWVLVIALGCLIAGVVVARLVDRLRLAAAAPIIVVASCAGLTWYGIGVQFQFGFINTSYAVAILTAAWLAYSAGRRHPVVALGTLLVLGTAVLEVWSPLVACIAGLGAVLLVREFAAFPRARWYHWLFTGVSAAVFLGYGVFVTLPGFLALSTLLGADGGFPNIGPASIFVIVAITLFLAVLVGSFGGFSHFTAGAIAFVATYGVALGYLIYQRRGALNDWGYYPAKFAWTGSIVLLVIAVCFAAMLIQRYPPRRKRDIVVGVAAAGVLMSLLWAPGTSPRPISQVPLVGIISGDVFGLSNRLSDVVFSLSGRDNGQDMLWRSATGDYWPNFWLLQVDLQNPDQHPARSFAHYTNGLGAADVCEAVRLIDEPVTIHTADVAAQAELDALCGDLDYTVAVDGL